MKILVGAELGWSLLPQTIADESLRRLTTDMQLTRELGVVLHRKKSLSNAANELLALV